MKSVLDQDIWYDLVAMINSRQTLATLCRVSKGLRRLCHPLLYREVEIQDCSLEVFENFVALPQDSHLQYTRKLCLGRNIANTNHWYHYSSLGRKDAESLDKDRVIHLLVECLKKMPNLVSIDNTAFLMYSQLFRDWFEFDAKSYASKRALKRASKRLGAPNEAIRDFVAISPVVHSRKMMSLPHFQNLRKLVLDPVERFSAGSRTRVVVDRIAEVLLASPRLESLTLTCETYDTLGVHAIHLLANLYGAKIKGSNASRLQLKELELGPEFIPCPPSCHRLYLTPEAGYHGNPIIQLTDLDYLQKLTLRTEVLSYIGSQPTWRSYCLDETCFYPAINLEHLSIDTRQLAATGLADYLCRLDKVKLVSFQDKQFLNYTRGPASSKVDPWKYAPYTKFHHWETLDLGDIFVDGDTKESQEMLLSALTQCAHLKTLTISLPESILEYFREKVLPQMESLENLFITSGPFDQGIPFVERNIIQQADCVSAKVDADKYIKEWREGHEERHRNNKKTRRSFALAMFESGRPNANSTETARKTRLKYLGLGYRVYTELYPSTSEDGRTRWKLYELSLDDAKTFEPIRQLLKGTDRIVRHDADHVRINKVFPFGAYTNKPARKGDIQPKPEVMELIFHSVPR